ncbi:tRNA (cytosine(34)-C(5))-methyltransferase, mitochondrial [Xiphophorus hellerii]|uniref:tRNA (cytosine(34)-C(5))-methyltransferase, mitochondrial n=1 Tax=Xiphophorus hellerii TaxID=8084 RepID=UPI0013B39248|nr:tRNA (cytosine(34)-C(5))-methyltransferase, mitochondrial [Xiphophorus hellerii]
MELYFVKLWGTNLMNVPIRDHLFFPPKNLNESDHLVNSWHFENSTVLPVRRFYIMRRKICLEPRTARTFLRWLSSFACRPGPDGSLWQNKQQRSLKNKIRNTGKSRRQPCPAVLDHFDQQYSEELGDLWASARAVLLDPPSWQYGVMLNRFSSVTDITQILRSQGFSSLLPQTDVSELLHNNDSAVSNSPRQEGKDTLSPHFSKRPPEDVGLLPYTTSHAFSQAHQSERPPKFPPSSLQCYVHPHPLRFPSQAHRPGQLKQYYLLNAASLLPVLALQVRDGDKVLDLCSAPGGKAVAITQSATPALLRCNEPDPHRRDWLAKTLESFLPPSLCSRVMVSAQDGRFVGQSEAVFYDKVLVDAPCSNDRSWLHSSNKLRGQQRLEDRARLPELQTQLLRSAISAVRPGGVVVYSTCTLSSLENCAVVEAVLKDFPDAEVENLWEEIALPLSKYFAVISFPGQKQTEPKPSLHPLIGSASTFHHKLGILVVPQPGRTWGPMFLSRIRKKR